MTHSASLLRSHRKRSGMKLDEMARIVGYEHGGEISRHERLSALPSLRAALAYEALFHTSVRLLFPALFEEIKRDVETRLAALIEGCHQSTVTGRAGALIARKLVWAWERANQDQSSLFDLSEHARRQSARDRNTGSLARFRGVRPTPASPRLGHDLLPAEERGRSEICQEAFGRTFGADESIACSACFAALEGE